MLCEESRWRIDVYDKHVLAEAIERSGFIVETEDGLCLHSW